MTLMRAALPAFALCLAAFAVAPSAEAAPTCDLLGETTNYDQTWALPCVPADCIYNTAPSGWLGCRGSQVARVGQYADCYLTTGPIYWFPDCT